MDDSVHALVCGAQWPVRGSGTKSKADEQQVIHSPSGGGQPAHRRAGRHAGRRAANLYRKLRVDNRRAAVTLAKALGLLTSDQAPRSQLR